MLLWKRPARRGAAPATSKERHRRGMTKWWNRRRRGSFSFDDDEGVSTVAANTLPTFWWRSSSNLGDNGDGDSLDVTKHRSASVESLLSLERSTVTLDDRNRMRLVPCHGLRLDDDDAVPTEVISVVSGSDAGAVNDDNVGLDIFEEEEEEDDDDDDDHRGRVGLESRPPEKDPARTVSPAAAVFDADGEAPSSSSALAPQQQASAGATLEKTSRSEIETTTTTTTEKNKKGILKNRADDDDNDVSAGDRRGNDGSSSVRFGTVEVHEHTQELAASSVPLRGPPLGLGWIRTSRAEFDSVEDHQRRRRRRGLFAADEENDDAAHPRHRRSLLELHQPPSERVDRLLGLGYTLREIRAATRETGISRTNRIRSARFSSRRKLLSRGGSYFRRRRGGGDEKKSRRPRFTSAIGERPPPHGETDPVAVVVSF